MIMLNMSHSKKYVKMCSYDVVFPDYSVKSYRNKYIKFKNPFLIKNALVHLDGYNPKIKIYTFDIDSILLSHTQ